MLRQETTRWTEITTTRSALGAKILDTEGNLEEEQAEAFYTVAPTSQTTQPITRLTWTLASLRAPRIARFLDLGRSQDNRNTRSVTDPVAPT